MSSHTVYDMGGQVLGGGVIIAVAVALWLVYLLPSLHSSHQFNAAERNAVRLNQALRILAETSETPQEVRMELNARTAMAQQKLARRAQAERENAELDTAKAELETARLERERARALPAARRARARRRARTTATAMALLAFVVGGVGTWQLVSVGTSTLLWAAGAVLLGSVVVLQRMAAVSRRAHTVVAAPAAVRTQPVVQDVPLVRQHRDTQWQPRTLPRPLSSSVGSAAAVVRDAADAREALRAAAIEEAKRQQAAKVAPRSIDTARVVEPAASGSAYSRMGYVDDAEIEAHVRDLLERRVAG